MVSTRAPINAASLAAWGELPPARITQYAVWTPKKASDSAFDGELKKNAIAPLYCKVYNDLGGQRVVNIKDRQRGCATPSLYFKSKNCSGVQLVHCDQYIRTVVKASVTVELYNKAG